MTRIHASFEVTMPKFGYGEFVIKFMLRGGF